MTFTPRTFPLKSKVWTTPMRRPWYLHPEMAEKGMRWELPYEERLMKIGEELKERLHEKGVHFWDHQLRDYEALPSWEDYPGIFENQAKNYGKDPKEYDLWFINTKSIMYAWSHNVTIPLMAEAADQVLGHKGVMMHPSTAEKRGIKHGDKVWIESPLGRVEGTAFLREGIRPDCILVEGQFGQWVTPLAKDFGIPCSNPLMPLNYETTDAGGSAQDLVKVKVYKKG
jgi:phenylacetyl-CoA:acceptor oxidoreductase